MQYFVILIIRYKIESCKILLDVSVMLPDILVSSIIRMFLQKSEFLFMFITFSASLVPCQISHFFIPKLVRDISVANFACHHFYSELKISSHAN